MPTQLQKVEFSERLQQSLARAGVSASSPTQLARKFNLLSPGNPVSPQAVRRWLEGTAIPTQDKLVVLADWLRVSAEWLRFGDAGKMTKTKQAVIQDQQPSYDPRTLATMVELLTPANREAVWLMVKSLLASEGKDLEPPKRR